MTIISYDRRFDHGYESDECFTTESWATPVQVVQESARLLRRRREHAIAPSFESGSDSDSDSEADPEYEQQRRDGDSVPHAHARADELTREESRASAGSTLWISYLR